MAWPAIFGPDEFDDLFQRRARKKDFINASPFQQPGIRLRDRSAAAAEHANAAGSFLTQLLQHFAEELDMATVIRGDANSLDVLLNGRPNNVAHRAMVAQINDFDAVA